MNHIKIILFFTVLSMGLISKAYAATCIGSTNIAIEPTTDHLQISIDGSTVYDPKSNLTWQRCSNGGSWNGNICEFNSTKRYWGVALAETGNSSWRLPNIKELSSILELRCHSPAINSTVFPDISAGDLNTNYFWTSSPVFASGSNQTNAIALDLSKGAMRDPSKNNEFNHIFVRTGQ